MHETSLVDDEVKIGKGTKIWHFSHILKGSVLGENVTVGQNVVIGPQVKVGDRCKIQNNVSLYKGVHLEEEVFCGPSCVFTNVYNPRAFIERKHEFLDTLVKRGATIGANATVVCGNHSGQVLSGGGRGGGQSRRPGLRHSGGGAGQADRLGLQVREDFKI